MAQKIITDLQLRSGVTDGLSVPADDGIQSYRVTGVQIKNYVLATGNVGTTSVADGAITSTKVAAGNIGTPALADASVTLPKLDSAVQAQFVPVGSVLPTARATAAPGFLLCDGSQVARATYPALDAVLTQTHGSYTNGAGGAGTTHLRLPDYRGRFLRMVDGGAANDPDRAARTAMNTGGNTGDAVGSVQGDQLASHRHTMEGWGANTGGGQNQTSGGGSGNINTSYFGGNESRPKNANIQLMIKY